MTWFPLLFALGACLGSFVNLVSLRLPALLDGQFINGDRADVPGLVAARFPLYCLPYPVALLPEYPDSQLYLFVRQVWILYRIRISSRYPVIEVIAAVTAVMLGVIYEPDWQLAAVMLFVCALLTLSLIDIDHQVLPDLLVLPLLWTGLLFNSLSLFVDLHLAVFGAVAGYLVLWLSCQAHHILTGRAGMGHGDFKLFAAIGAWLGVQTLPWVLVMACGFALLGSAYLTVFRGQAHGAPLAYGPFALAGAITIIFRSTT